MLFSHLVSNLAISTFLIASYILLQELKNQRDKLKQYQKKINVQIGKDREVAKQLLKDGKKE